MGRVSSLHHQHVLVALFKYRIGMRRWYPKMCKHWHLHKACSVAWKRGPASVKLIEMAHNGEKLLLTFVVHYKKLGKDLVLERLHSLSSTEHTGSIMTEQPTNGNSEGIVGLDEPKKMTREDWRKKKELEEQRKLGNAPAEVDEEGK